MAKQSDAKQLHVQQATTAIHGLAVLDNLLYVLRDSRTDQIQVYETKKYTWKRQHSVPGLRGFGDMSSCLSNRCLYVSDPVSVCIHRVSSQSTSHVTQWLVNSKPAGLSTTPANNVLVCCVEERKLKEFSTDGEVLREILLQTELANPTHAIELNCGRFLVCHGLKTDGLQEICLVDSEGNPVKLQEGSSSCALAVKQVTAPYHLAVDKDGYIFVADMTRVLLVNPAYKYERQIRSRSAQWVPYRVCVDEKRRRLIVAENEFAQEGILTGRLAALELPVNFTQQSAACTLL